MNPNSDKSLVPGSERDFNSLGFFSSGEHFVFIHKKTEKIVQAIYLVTQHIKDTEPIKYEIREQALSLLATSLALNSAEQYDENSLIVTFFSSTLKIDSYFKVASISGLISQNNAYLIQSELTSLLNFIKSRLFDDPTKTGFVLSKDFFATDMKTDSKENVDKRHLITSPKNQISYRDKIINKNNDNLKDKKNLRQESILNLLKVQSHLTIKDFVKVISDCSEKTIQRELIDLVNRGIVKKEGERRWSRYSLK